jgi:hypothetical protein
LRNAGTISGKGCLNPNIRRIPNTRRIPINWAQNNPGAENIIITTTIDRVLHYMQRASAARQIHLAKELGP